MDPIARRARRLRTNSTDAERRLWQALRYRRFAGHKFRRQRPTGPYIVDFVCLDHRLVIEVDGGHHAEQQAYDAARDRWLREHGYRVLRFSDREVLTQIESVEQAIWMALEEEPPDPHPSPPPSAGEGTEGDTLRR